MWEPIREIMQLNVKIAPSSGKITEQWQTQPEVWK